MLVSKGRGLVYVCGGKENDGWEAVCGRKGEKEPYILIVRFESQCVIATAKISPVC